MIKIECDSQDEFLKMLGKAPRADLEHMAKKIGHFVQNVGQYDLGAFIILNAHKFVHHEDWELVHKDYKKLGTG